PPAGTGGAVPGGRAGGEPRPGTGSALAGPSRADRSCSSFTCHLASTPAGRLSGSVRVRGAGSVPVRFGGRQLLLAVCLVLSVAGGLPVDRGPDRRALGVRGVQVGPEPGDDARAARPGHPAGIGGGQGAGRRPGREHGPLLVADRTGSLGETAVWQLA